MHLMRSYDASLLGGGGQQRGRRQQWLRRSGDGDFGGTFGSFGSFDSGDATVGGAGEMFGGGAGGVGQVAGVARHVVMVRNLPPRAGELDVAAAMGRCGRVKSVRIFNRYRVGEDEVRPLSIQSIDRSYHTPINHPPLTD